MPPREPEPLLGKSHFRVRIGRRELGFAEVGRLTSETDLTLPDQPHDRLETVVLRRALTGSRELYEWRRRIVDGIADRRPVTISQLDGPGGRIVNSWRLERAWPCRWSGPAFNAAETGLAYEELELAFDDLVWLEPRRPPKRTQGG
ncbi:MAG TPA: phage tail protein [Gaiellaceae bacterium]|nr:phage tail protein [Gaiellaceae bacterium]